MNRPRWAFGHLVALVELACGVVGLVWLVVVGIEAEAAGSAGRSLLDRAFPFLLGAALGVGLGGLSVRSWRSADQEARQANAPAPPASPPASLSPDGMREVARVVAVLAAAGVFAPQVPEPEQLSEAVADAGEPVTAEVVLMAVAEAGWHRPGFHSSEYVVNLAFHDSHVEQDVAGLRAQVEDVVRLCRGQAAAVVEVGHPDGAGRIPTRIQIAAGGDEWVLDYAGAAKELSTVLHVSLARMLRERGAGRRLAWLWSDQGVWLTGLPDGEVERLNAALGQAAGEGWAWVDKEPPTAAGDLEVPRRGGP
jgi:hypothetical protein